jgi:acyl-CoA thioesterase-2
MVPVPDGTPAPLGRTGAGRLMAWLKVTDPLGDDELLQRCWLAYLSDDLPTESVGRALGFGGDPSSSDGIDSWGGVMSASLDHTIWFHRPVLADQWHLQDFTCHGYVGGRGLSIGHIFSIDGVHVATVAQEVVLRETEFQRER